MLRKVFSFSSRLYFWQVVTLSKLIMDYRCLNNIYIYNCTTEKIKSSRDRPLGWRISVFIFLTTFFCAFKTPLNLKKVVLSPNNSWTCNTTGRIITVVVHFRILDCVVFCVHQNVQPISRSKAFTSKSYRSSFITCLLSSKCSYLVFSSFKPSLEILHKFIFYNTLSISKPNKIK